MIKIQIAIMIAVIAVTAPSIYFMRKIAWEQGYSAAMQKNALTQLAAERALQGRLKELGEALTETGILTAQQEEQLRDVTRQIQTFALADPGACTIGFDSLRLLKEIR